jgi:hypothetical protein
MIPTFAGKGFHSMENFFHSVELPDFPLATGLEP